MQRGKGGDPDVPPLVYAEVTPDPTYGERIQLRRSMPAGERPYDTALVPEDYGDDVPTYAEMPVTYLESHQRTSYNDHSHYKSNEPMYMDEQESKSKVCIEGEKKVERESEL